MDYGLIALMIWCFAALLFSLLIFVLFDDEAKKAKKAKKQKTVEEESNWGEL